MCGCGDVMGGDGSSSVGTFHDDDDADAAQAGWQPKQQEPIFSFGPRPPRLLVLLR